MIQPISNLFPTSRIILETQTENIEQYPGWHGEMTLIDINIHLENKESLTYMITKLESNTFLLSFVRNDDQGILHIQFQRLADGNWYYRNGQDNIVPNLGKIIKKMMHWTDSMPEPSPLS